MINRPIPIPIRICWCFVCPVVLSVTLFVVLTNYTSPVYDGYEYPYYSTIIGIIIGLLPVIPVPAVMIYQILSRKGSFVEKLKSSIQPASDWLPFESKYRNKYAGQQTLKPNSIIEMIKMNAFGYVSAGPQRNGDNNTETLQSTADLDV